ncbi:MAG: hypothetical protein KDA96_22975, partial [Planctomycetaceae bacterium]|nr:hypothetical protein [Planctomycetaceae bacterium]
VLLVPGADATAQQPPSASTILGSQGTQLTINGRPAFLLGVSYYGALGASEEFLRRDLDDFQTHGFNWVRIWATWGAFDHDVSAVDGRGEPREAFLRKLQWLVAECDRRGMIVDVTLSRGKLSSRALSGGNLPDFSAHQRAVDVIVNAIKSHRNWYLDLANERDVRDDRFVSVEELTQLRAQVRKLDPQRLVTASFGGHDLSKDDVRDALIAAGQDFLSVHRPRNPQSPQQTEIRTRELLTIASQLQKTVPVHHQEPFRRGYGNWEPSAEDFLTDLRGAVAGHAAGWCFHNGSQRNTPDNHPRRSFDMREQRLIDQLDDEERTVLSKAYRVVHP